MKKNLLFFVLGLATFFSVAATRRGLAINEVVTGTVTEPMFSFSNVTTANATTNQHGLFPRLPVLSDPNHPALYHPVQGWKTNSSIWRWLLKNPSDTSSTDGAGNILVQDADGWFNTLSPGGENSVLAINGGAPAWHMIEDLFNDVIDEPMFNFTDIATANSSTSEHGLMPKLNGDANTFFNGNGGQTAVSEAGLSLSDNTTGNATTLRHGFAPKLSGNASDAFRGDGTWGAVASESGGDFTYMRVIHESETIDFDTIDENVPYGLNVTVTGAEVGDPVVVVANWATSGLTFHGIVTAPNTVELQVLNLTDAPINPASQDFEIYVFDQDTVDAPFGSGIETTITATVSAAPVLGYVIGNPQVTGWFNDHYSTSGSPTWSGNGTVAAGETAYRSVTVTGAAVGDVVTISQPVIAPGVTASAVVVGSNTVQIRLHNIGGATFALGGEAALYSTLTHKLVLTRIE